MVVFCEFSIGGHFRCKGNAEYGGRWAPRHVLGAERGAVGNIVGMVSCGHFSWFYYII